VLALQGDFEAHARMVRAAGSVPVEVRTEDELAGVDALVVPGGESTTFRILARRRGLVAPVLDRAKAGLPILGTCAGLIACARTILDGDEPIWPLVDLDVRRNAYGRQVDSFETDLDVAGVGAMHAIFIRAPRIERVGDGVDVLASYDGAPVVVRRGAITLAAFHPELSGDHRLHALLG